MTSIGVSLINYLAIVHLYCSAAAADGGRRTVPPPPSVNDSVIVWRRCVCGPLLMQLPSNVNVLIKLPYAKAHYRLNLMLETFVVNKRSILFRRFKPSRCVEIIWKIPVTGRQPVRLRRGNGEVGGDVADKSTGTSRVCRGYHGKIGIVEFGLYKASQVRYNSSPIHTADATQLDTGA